MTEFDFVLTFALGRSASDPDVLVERLGSGGCDDAVVGVGKRGRLALAFTREADDAARAMSSAIADVRRAVPEATLIEAAPDLVGLSDVAALLRVTRQNARKLVVDCEALAPPPVHEGHPTLWRLAKLLDWLRNEKGYAVSDELVELAAITMQINLAIASRDADVEAQREIRALLA